MQAQTRATFYQGLAAGVIGCATVAAVFALANLLQGRAVFHTVALFGAAVFGTAGGGEAAASWQAILSYNMLHVLAFLALGQIAAWLAALTERHPVMWLPVLLVLIFVSAHLYTFLVLFSLPLPGSVAWWLIAIPSLTAAALMAIYLLERHPLLRREIREGIVGSERFV